MPTDYVLDVTSGVHGDTLVLRQPLTCPHDLSIGGPRLATDIFKVAATQTLQWFIKAYIPLRFEGYARTVLGYTVLGKTDAKKRRMAGKFDAATKRTVAPDSQMPNVWTGDTRAKALMARVVTVAKGGATSGNVEGNIVIDIPRYVAQGRNLQTKAVLYKITDQEAKRIAQVFASAVDAIAGSLLVMQTMTRNGTIKTRAVMNAGNQMTIGRNGAGSSRSVATIARTA